MSRYQKNLTMDYIQPDESSLTVFDPESGNAYFFDEIGISILRLLQNPMDFNQLLAALSTEYNAPVDDIRSDVEEFLELTLQSGVVLSSESES